MFFLSFPFLFSHNTDMRGWHGIQWGRRELFLSSSFITDHACICIFLLYDIYYIKIFGYACFSHLLLSTCSDTLLGYTLLEFSSTYYAFSRLSALYFQAWAGAISSYILPFPGGLHYCCSKGNTSTRHRHFLHFHKACDGKPTGQSSSSSHITYHSFLFHYDNDTRWIMPSFFFCLFDIGIEHGEPSSRLLSSSFKREA